MTFITKDELKAAVELVMRRIQGQDQLIDMLIDQLSETNLRLRYVMESLRYEKPSLLVGGPKEIETLLDRYLNGGRDYLLKEIEDAREAVPENGSREEREAVPYVDATGRPLDDATGQPLRPKRARARGNGKATDSRSH